MGMGEFFQHLFLVMASSLGLVGIPLPLPLPPLPEDPTLLRAAPAGEGFDFDLAGVPRLQALVPHLGPELVVLRQTDGGCQLTRRGSLPVVDPLLVTCGMACLMHSGR